MKLIHICGEKFEADVHQSHGVTLFDPAECPSCGQYLVNSETQPDEKKDNCLMDRQQAQITVKRYCCSNCWGPLTVYAQEVQDLVRVLCFQCGEETKGYVTQYYATQRRLESAAAKATASIVLRNVIPSPASGKTQEQLLQELGF